MKKLLLLISLAVLAGTFYFSHSANNQSDSLFNKNGQPRKSVQRLFQHLGSPVNNLEEANYVGQTTLLRKGERWETQEQKEWHTQINTNRAALIKDLSALGMIEPVEPQQKAYTYALMMGALKERVHTRLDYLAELKQKGFSFKIIVLLGGERPLQAAEKAGLPADITTEAEMMKYVYEHHPLLKNDTFMLVNAPMVKKEDGTLLRPTTDSTLVLFALEAPLDGSCLVISNNPYTMRQTKVAQRILDQKRFPTAGAGSGIQDTNKIDLVMIMDEFARTIYEEYTAQKAAEAKNA